MPFRHTELRQRQAADPATGAFTQDDENPAAFPVPESDRTALKSGIVPVMIQLSSLPNLQVQVGEAIAVMAEHDFPLEWPNLVNVSGNLSA